MPERAPSRIESQRTPYLIESRRPLPILVLLLPLVALYELGSVLLLSDASEASDLPSHTVRAHHLLEQAIRLFGVSGVYLPGILLVLVLLVWQIAWKHPWRVRPLTVVGMAIESVAWTVPLLVLSVISTDLLGLGRDGGGVPAAAAGGVGWLVGLVDGGAVGGGVSGGDGVSDEGWRVWLLVAIGAGVYEELLFRLLGLSGIAWILRRGGQLSGSASAWIAVATTSVLFALYHDLSTTPGGIAWGYVVYFTVLGVAFGALYLFRGFGIVVAAHALLDTVLLLWW
ncbi:MAG: lysostaphin resistance A-like protein [Phycisphaerales bacterium]